MIALKKILVPVDFSEYSDLALDYGRELAEKFIAEVHLLNVVDDYFVLAPEAYLAMPDREQYRDDLLRAAEKQLGQVPHQTVPNGVNIVRSVVTGKPFVEIIRYAKDKAIDLIVMGSHGRTGMSHLLMGSVAENVVRKASCPVLTVRTRQHCFVMP